MAFTKHAIGSCMYICSNDATTPTSRGAGNKVLVISAHGAIKIKANPAFDGTNQEEEPPVLLANPMITIPPTSTHPNFPTLHFSSELGRPADEDDLTAVAGLLQGSATANISSYCVQTVAPEEEIRDYVLMKYRGETLANPKPWTGKQVYTYIKDTLLNGSTNFDVLTPRNRKSANGILMMSEVVNALKGIQCYGSVFCSFCRVSDMDQKDQDKLNKLLYGDMDDDD